MLQKRLALLPLIVGILGLSGAAANAADDPAPPPDKGARMLEKHPEADVNKDGKLSSEEWTQFRQNRKGAGRGPAGEAGQGRQRGGPGDRKPDPERLLKAHPELDTNKDGKLSDEEMQAGRHKLMGMGRMGGPGMGPPPPPAAVLDMLLKRFAEADTDGNGQLSRDEIAAFKDKLPPPPPGPGAGLGGPGAGFGGPGQPGAWHAGMAEDLIKSHPEADTDRDGKLSPDEMRALMKNNPGAMRQLFLQRHPDADANKDGQLSDEEMKTYRETMRAEHRANRPGAPANP